MSVLKKRIGRRFERALNTYEKAAVVQAQMARRLVSCLAELRVSAGRVLEIGAGTGLFTRYFLEAFTPCFYLASDLLPACSRFFQGFPCYFVAADGEDPSWVKGPFDLIVSNATFQWFLALEQALKGYHALLVPGGHLAFTTFGPNTMKEVHWAAGKQSHLLPAHKLRQMGQKLFKKLKEEHLSVKLYFRDPLAVLRHIRATGAMGFLPTKWSLRELKTWQERYQGLKEEKGFPLTYETLLFVWEKR